MILADYHYEKIWLGIRPEHFYLENNSNSETLPVIVNLIESLGNETILKVHLKDEENHNLQVRINPDLAKEIQQGETINLGINLTKISLFDYYQQENILTRN